MEGGVSHGEMGLTWRDGFHMERLVLHVETGPFMERWVAHGEMANHKERWVIKWRDVFHME